MASMYELTSDYQSVLAMATDGETDADCIADTLEAIGGEIEIKAESSAIIMQELKAESEKLKAEIERLTARKKSIESNADIIKNRLYEAMKLTGKEKFKTALFSFSIGKNPVKLVVDDVENVPQKYLIPQPPKIDNAALKEDLKAAEDDFVFAHLEQSESLRIK